jgi:hypothetical protein
MTSKIDTAGDATRPLLKETDAAKRLGMEPATLRKWRVIGKGPDFVIVGGRSIRYDPNIIDAYILNGTRSSTSQNAEV